MKPEDINKLNKQRNKIEKVYKYCHKCHETQLVSGYISKCPICRAALKNCEQPQSLLVPHCPTCNSTNILKISDLRRGIHGLAWGLLSNTARSQFECKNCGYKW